jgi:hypothetical protein
MENKFPNSLMPPKCHLIKIGGGPKKMLTLIIRGPKCWFLSAMLYSTEDYNTKLDDSIEN